MLLINSAEFDVNIQGIITAQFRTGTWFGRRNTLGMKCAHNAVCGSFSRTRSRFFKRETILTFQKNGCHAISGDKYWSSVFSPGWRAAGEKEKKKGISLPLDSFAQSLHCCLKFQSWHWNLPQPVDPRPVAPLPPALYKCHLNLLTLHWFDRLKLDYMVQVRFRLNNAGSGFCWLLTGAPVP